MTISEQIEYTSRQRDSQNIRIVLAGDGNNRGCDNAKA